MTSIVVGIYSAAAAGAPMLALGEATLEAGRGLRGDRYHAGAGTFSQKLHGKPDREITLIESEQIERFNSAESLAIPAGDFRRNIVTRGVALNELAGRRFNVGAAVLEGIRLCEPCAHLAQLLSPKVLTALVHRAGLRARIVTGATIRPGDSITVPAESAS